MVAENGPFAPGGVVPGRVSMVDLAKNYGHYPNFPLGWADLAALVQDGCLAKQKQIELAEWLAKTGRMSARERAVRKLARAGRIDVPTAEAIVKAAVDEFGLGDAQLDSFSSLLAHMADEVLAKA